MMYYEHEDFERIINGLFSTEFVGKEYMLPGMAKPNLVLHNIDLQDKMEYDIKIGRGLEKVSCHVTATKDPAKPNLIHVDLQTNIVTGD